MLPLNKSCICLTCISISTSISTYIYIYIYIYLLSADLDIDSYKMHPFTRQRRIISYSGQRLWLVTTTNGLFLAWDGATKIKWQSFGNIDAGRLKYSNIVRLLDTDLNFLVVLDRQKVRSEC